MNVFIERDGGVECGSTTFTPSSGIKIQIRMDDGVALIRIQGIECVFDVCEKFPLSIVIYEDPIEKTK